MKKIIFLAAILIAGTANSQTLPPARSVDWTLAGLRDTTTSGFLVIDMQNSGAIGDGITPNDSVMSAVLSSITGLGAILEFSDGNFLFNNTIDIPSNIIIRGQGANNTTFTMSLGGAGHAIDVQGLSISTDTTSLVQPAVKDSSYIMVSDTAGFSTGDWVQIIQIDTDLVTDNWAENTVGQIVEIEDIINNKIALASPLRMDYDTARSPYIRKIVPVQNVGIECLKINRTDDTAPQQTSTIYFNNAVNCWVIGIESQNCTFSHITATYSSNLSISKSYIHHAFDYGGGGRAYGVMLHFTTNECLVEDNVFEHLRHSMIVQAGANGNVFAFNYSFDPFWSANPSDAAGDVVLHGNYPYSNLFEQNICQNIIIDNSHGPNGPYNTFFRNRAESFGIFFSAGNSPNQNLVGNDIPNMNPPYSLVNYTIQGTGHFIHGNNNKGTIDPPGTEALPDSSYAYTEQPGFVPAGQWAAIGTPNVMGAADIPALDRYNSGNIFNNSCGYLTGGTKDNFEKEEILIYPNPTTGKFRVEGLKFGVETIEIYDLFGRLILRTNEPEVDMSNYPAGIYFVKVGEVVRKLVKQ